MGDMGGYGRVWGKSLQGARVRAGHVDKFETLSQPISNIANGPNQLFGFKMFQFEVPPRL